MIGRHHAMIGTAVSLTVLMTSGITLPQQLGIGIAAIAVGTIAALLPDIDGHDSDIRNNFGLGRQQIQRDFRRRRHRSFIQRIFDAMQWVVSLPLDLFAYLVPHRGPTHWLLTAALLTFAVTTLVRFFGWHDWLWICFGVGYLSHILADGLTVAGVPFFGPLYRRSIGFLPRPFRIRTGSMQEYLLVEGSLGLYAVAILIYAVRGG
jgi:inner membrane protein